MYRQLAGELEKYVQPRNKECNVAKQLEINNHKTHLYKQAQRWLSCRSFMCTSIKSITVHGERVVKITIRCELFQFFAMKLDRHF